jgi:hypothetical protein
VYYRLTEQDSPEYTALIAFLKRALIDKLFVADRKRLAKAIKEGACSVSELKPGVVSARPALQPHMRR